MIINQNFIEERPLSKSSLKAFRKSPRHYLLYLQQKFEPTPSMILGSVVDTLTLEPDEFDNRFVVFQKATGKGSMAANNEMKMKAAKKKITLITEKQYKTAKICVESLYSHNESRQILEAKKNIQKRLSWRNKATNLPLIGYQDFESHVWDTDFLIELKTSVSSDPSDFNRAAANLNYDMDVGAYLDAHHKIWYRFPSFIFLVVETSEPYNTSVIFVEDSTADEAKNEFYGTLKAFRYCMNNYPDFNVGYEFKIMKTREYFRLKFPKWKKKLFND